MKQPANRTPSLKLLCFALISSFTGMATANIGIPETPLLASQTFTPMTMLVLGRDHTLFFEAYNDASDLDGDGILDLYFKPSITYYGLFDSKLCYGHTNGSATTGLFSPVSVADADGKCPGKWSGNWLNYITTSRIDALRKVFYGGHRDPASTSTNTILRRAYIPQDGHSWAKEYTSVTVDGYDISDYTPLSLPNAERRHFFGNLTANGSTNCQTLNTCSNLAPWLSVVTNSNKRVWEWASSERLVLRNDTHGGARTNYTVRVQVCTAAFNSGCKKYPNGSFKPVGLLHEYGESEAMYFGLLTGSYNKNMSGGVLRKVMSSFKNEVNQETGDFTTNATIVKTMDSLRIRDFNNDKTDGSYRNGSFRTGPMKEGDYPDWGNPVGEMMYEALRYFAGKKSPSTAFSTSGSHDGEVFKGLTPPAWDDPYASDSAAKAQWCAKPNLLVMSSVNVSYDSDQVPGSAFSNYAGDLSGLNASAIGDKITQHEPSVPGKRYIGAVGSLEDFAPTAKNVTTLGNLRGLAPEEPTKQGSYYSASVAHYGKITDLNSAKGDQKTDTYVVALASPMPKFEFNIGGKTISLVPFAKTIDGSSTNRTKGKYQPTDPIVDLYIEEYTSDRVKFRINYEADEQGNDFDMDVVVEYEIINKDGTLTVKVKPTYESTGSNQNIGYVITGTKEGDGVYLVVQDKNESLNYYLNVPPGRRAGYCDSTTDSDPNPFPAGCAQLPWIGAAAPNNQSVQTFTTGGTSSATVLNNPLWFAAKWGGFTDRNGNGIPDLKLEWDQGNDGTPDNYFLVQNPTKLEEALNRSFRSIVEKAASSGNLSVNSTSITQNAAVFQSTYETKHPNGEVWTGDLEAFKVTEAGVSVTLWKASEKLPANRAIFTSNGVIGVPFTWPDEPTSSTLTADQKAALGSQNVLNYLRGDQSKEISKGGTLRNRVSLIGDIVHSSPYYVKDSDTLYVGANDGMLHAFDASNGTELFAFIPSALFGKLATLSSPDYTHTFFVDGEIAVSTKAQTPAKNILVGAPGRGAKGLFALNVTNPKTFSASDVLWEYTETDDSALSDSLKSGDLGFILGQPVIAKLNNGSTAVIVGNGYNSINGDAVLFIFNLETGELIRKLSAGKAGNNGLATPTVFDKDGDGVADYVYAGDLKGNVWKYDLNDKTDPEKWDFAYKTPNAPAPLFTAKDSSNKAQPITAPLQVKVNMASSGAHAGKTFVFFGTGSYMANGDPTNHDIQTWYGLVDDGVIADRSELVQRSFVINKGTILNGETPVITRSVAKADADDMLNKKGWYLDLRDPVARGERIVSRSIFINALKPVLEVASIIPVDGDPCDAKGDGFINFVNPFTGAQLDFVFIDVNGDGKFDENDMIDGEYPSSINPEVGMPGEPVLIGKTNLVGGTSGKITMLNKNFGGKSITGRMSWREIITE